MVLDPKWAKLEVDVVVGAPPNDVDLDAKSVIGSGTAVVPAGIEPATFEVLGTHVDEASVIDESVECISPSTSVVKVSSVDSCCCSVRASTYGLGWPSAPPSLTTVTCNLYKTPGSSPVTVCS